MEEQLIHEIPKIQSVEDELWTRDQLKARIAALETLSKAKADQMAALDRQYAELSAHHLAAVRILSQRLQEWEQRPK